YQLFFYNYLPCPLSYIFDFIYSCFLIGSVSVMLAGSGMVFHSLLGLPYLIGVIITIVFILITLALNHEGILTVNSVLIPVLLFITIYTVISFLCSSLPAPVQVDAQMNPEISKMEWFYDSLLYGSYNLVMAIAVMTNILYKEEEENITAAGILGGITLTVLLLIIFFGLISIFPQISEFEMPILYLAGKVSRLVYLLYILALYFAMVTTAIANYYAFTMRFISLVKIKYNTGLILGLFFIFPLIPSGFAKLVDMLYPVFGCLGMLIIFFYIVLLIKYKKK
ncbi:MAG: hypothetical protein ACLFUI_05730, partial [Halanaerobiales bacterium]